MPAQELDNIRRSVLDRMERGDRLVKWAIIAAAMVEGLLLVAAIFIADWSNPLHRLVFILSILTYSVVACGLVALAGHISRSVGRVLIALESMSSP
jgi:fatty acid desaturase